VTPPASQVSGGNRPGRWLLPILALAAVLRSYHLAYPAWDYHNWRQSITLMLARDFARHGFHLLHPQVAWIGGSPSAPSYFGAEFSIQSVLAAVLYRVFGESDAAARLVVIAFSLLGIYCLYELLGRRAGVAAAALGAFIYSLLPYHLFFGRVFMPDIPAISLALAGLNVLDRWTDSRKSSSLAAAAVLTALAILQKLPVAFATLPALYLFWLAYGRRLFARPEPYLFALIAGLPEAVWYAHIIATQQQNAFSAYAVQQLSFARHLGLWFEGGFAMHVFKGLSKEAFSALGLGLAVLGLCWFAQGRAAWIFRLWIAGAALFLFLIPDVVSGNLYYLTLLLPGGAALAGLTLARSARGRNTYALLAVVLAIYAAGAISAALPLYQSDRLPYDLGLLLRSLTQPPELLVTESGGSPNMLYAAERRGWLLEREYDMGRIQRLREQGASYYADTFAADAVQKKPFFEAMDKRFERLTSDDGPWRIYALAPPPAPFRALPAAFSQDSRTVDFGGQIRLLRVAIRTLLDWPASFEVMYYWQCLKPTPVNLRVFVHITDYAGRTVYQQDHWPQCGWLLTSQWKAGDIVRERYMLVLPGSLAGGKYQIRLGWFDPDRGPRLRIVNPGPEDRDDRALVAEITAGRVPVYGWFSPY